MLRSPTQKGTLHGIAHITQTARIAKMRALARQSIYYQSAEDMRFFSKDIKLSGGYAPWSESDLRLDPDVSLTDERVQYVYYGDPTVDLEKQGYVRQSRQSFDSMTVDTFIRR